MWSDFCCIIQMVGSGLKKHESMDPSYINGIIVWGGIPLAVSEPFNTN